MSQQNEIDNKEKDTNVPPPIQEDQKYNYHIDHHLYLYFLFRE